MKLTTTTKLKKLISAGLIGATLSSFAAGTTTYGSTSKFSCTDENFGKYTHNSDIYKDYIEDELKNDNDFGFNDGNNGGDHTNQIEEEAIKNLKESLSISDEDLKDENLEGVCNRAKKEGKVPEIVKCVLNYDEAKTGTIKTITFNNNKQETEIEIDHMEDTKDWIFMDKGDALIVLEVIPEENKWEQDGKVHYNTGGGFVSVSHPSGHNFVVSDTGEIDMKGDYWKLNGEDSIIITNGLKPYEVQNLEKIKAVIFNFTMDECKKIKNFYEDYNNIKDGDYSNLKKNIEKARDDAVKDLMENTAKLKADVELLESHKEAVAFVLRLYSDLLEKVSDDNHGNNALVTKENILQSINFLNEDESILIEPGKISYNLNESNPFSDILLNEMFVKNLFDFINENKIALVKVTKNEVNVMFNNGKTKVLKDENLAKLLGGDTNALPFEPKFIKGKEKIDSMDVEKNETDRNDFDPQNEFNSQNDLTGTNNYDIIIEDEESDDNIQINENKTDSYQDQYIMDKEERETLDPAELLFRKEEELRKEIERLSNKKIGELIYDTTPEGTEKSNEELLKACRGKKVVIAAKVKNGGIIGGYVDLNGEEKPHGENVFYLTESEKGTFKKDLYFVKENGYLESKKIFGDYFSWYDAGFISFDVEKCNLYKLDNQKLVIENDPEGDNGANYWIEDIKVYEVPSDTGCVFV